MINPSRTDLVATDGINQIEDKAMSDWEWFEKNVSIDKAAERRAEEKAMKREEKKRERSSSSSSKKGGWFGR